MPLARDSQAKLYLYNGKDGARWRLEGPTYSFWAPDAQTDSRRPQGISDYFGVGAAWERTGGFNDDLAATFVVAKAVQGRPVGPEGAAASGHDDGPAVDGHPLRGGDPPAAAVAR